MAEAQAHMVVRGHVQGVFFRASLQRQALTRGVRGWVRNRADGSVEALLQGTEDAVNAILAWARVGPRGAFVESLEVSWSDPEALGSGFDVRD